MRARANRAVRGCGPAAILLAGLLLQAALVAAEPIVTVAHHEYPVTGGTAAEIRQSLDRDTPVWQGGRPFSADTHCDIHWRLRWLVDADGTCRIDTVTVYVRVNYTMPHLETLEWLPADLADRWRRYMTALKAHEDRHAAFGVEAAREIEERIAVMAARPSCDQLSADANALAGEILDTVKRQETAFDQATDHGARDGAYFQ